ncbi:MAG: alpha-N-arabinofuranosidase, partial [Rhizobiaceae bacterium]
PYLKLSAVHSESDRTVTLFLLNRHLSDGIEVDLEATGFGTLTKQRAHELRHDNLLALNTKGKPDEVKPREFKAVEAANGRVSIRLAPASWTVVRFNASK